MVAMLLEQPTQQLQARRVQHVIKTFREHDGRHTLDPSRCVCTAQVADGTAALLQHAIEQLLISLPDTPVVEVPPDAELVDRALRELVRDEMPVDEASAEAVEQMKAWRTDVTRMHDQVYAPQIAAMVTELRTVGLAWETLAEVYASMLEEHWQERGLLRNELGASQRQVRQLQDKVRVLLDQVRELGGTVDDEDLAATPAVSVAQ